MWIATQMAVHVLHTFEREILGRMYGLMQEKDTGAIDGVAIATDLINMDGIKISRLGWAGHIKRAEEEGVQKKGS